MITDPLRELKQRRAVFFNHQRGSRWLGRPRQVSCTFVGAWSGRRQRGRWRGLGGGSDVIARPPMVSNLSRWPRRGTACLWDYPAARDRVADLRFPSVKSTGGGHSQGVGDRGDVQGPGMLSFGNDRGNTTHDDRGQGQRGLVIRTDSPSAYGMMSRAERPRIALVHGAAQREADIHRRLSASMRLRVAPRTEAADQPQAPPRTTPLLAAGIAGSRVQAGAGQLA